MRIRTQGWVGLVSTMVATFMLMTAAPATATTIATLQQEEVSALRQLGRQCFIVIDPAGSNEASACAVLNQNDFNSREFNGVGTLAPQEAASSYAITQVRLYFDNLQGIITEVAATNQPVDDVESSDTLSDITPSFSCQCGGQYYAEMDYQVVFNLGEAAVTGTVVSARVGV